jgi:Fe-S-cluster containining protein
MTALDCRTCGACCAGDLDDGYGFSDCTVDDVKRMSRHARSRVVRSSKALDLLIHELIPGLRSQRIMTPGVMTDEFGKICGFLRGTPGRRVSCGIYSSRPDICRTYQPGGRGCLAARKELGL